MAGGLEVVAYIGDTVCSEDPPRGDGCRTTTNGATVTIYRVQVLSAGAQKEGCGVAGSEVRFEVDGRRGGGNRDMWSEQASNVSI